MIFSMQNQGAHPFAAGPSAPPGWVSLGKVGFSNTAGKTLVPTHSEGASKLVLFGISQSNGINGAPLDGAFTPDVNVHNFNFYDGKTYRAVDPLLGAETTDQVVINNPGSHYMTKLGTMLKQADVADFIILVSISIGGAATAQWLGELKYRIRYALRAMAQEGLYPDFILSDFGESDNLNAVPAATLTARLREIVADFRLNGCDAPYFIAQVAKYQGATNDAQTRLGQANAWSDALGIYQGPDLDTIGNAYRASDQTHFLASGNTQKANMWLATLQSWIASHP